MTSCPPWRRWPIALAHVHFVGRKPHVGIPETVAVWAFGVAWLTKSGYYAWFYWLLALVRKLLPSHRQKLPNIQTSTMPPSGVSPSTVQE